MVKLVSLSSLFLNFRFTTVYLKLPYGQNEWYYYYVVYETVEAIRELLWKNWLEFKRELFLVSASLISGSI